MQASAVLGGLFVVMVLGAFGVYMAYSGGVTLPGGGGTPPSFWYLQVSYTRSQYQPTQLSWLTKITTTEPAPLSFVPPLALSDTMTFDIAIQGQSNGIMLFTGSWSFTAYNQPTVMQAVWRSDLKGQNCSVDVTATLYLYSYDVLISTTPYHILTSLVLP